MKRKQKRTFLGLVVILICGFLLFTISFLPFFGLKDLCGNKILSSIHIEGTNYKVVAFERDCGATTETSTHASIIKQGEELPNEGGNIFVCDSDHGKTPSGNGDSPELRVRIVGSDSIELSYDYRARIFLNQQEYKGIKIKYSTFVKADERVSLNRQAGTSTLTNKKEN